MSRNVENHFGSVPSADIGRSSFKRPFSHKTTFNTGDIVPIYVDEVLPGDTVKMRLSQLVRMTTPIYPVMDNAWIDIYFYFVPRRLTWNHFANFMGENTDDVWTETTQYTIPQIKAPTNGWEKGTIGATIYGIQGVGNISVDAQYVRSYVKIFNEWFRNQNVTEPADMSEGDADTQGSNGGSYVTDLQKGGKFAKAAKYADYFTKALPSPQKGPDIYLPLGITSVPVLTGETIDSSKLNLNEISYTLYNKTQFTQTIPNGEVYLSGIKNTAAQTIGGNQTKIFPTQTIDLGTSGGKNETYGITPNNLHADLSEVTGPTINELRQSFAIQRMYELDARGGTRLREICQMHFGCYAPDARMQVPEYLGGKRIPVNITQVIQQSSSDSTSPQGHTAAMSLTIDSDDMFTKSFTEWGILMGLAVVRTEHSYQQGINRIFNRKNRTDFYWPALSNIGEQYIKNKEIYAQGSTVVNQTSGNPYDEEAFGYQEAWAEYRYANNKITGELNSKYATPLDAYHYGDKYDSLPVLSDAWIRETDVNVGRTLAITDQDQWIADFYFDQTWIRPMPVYSIPSLGSWS